jgi:hypothetical protein
LTRDQPTAEEREQILGIVGNDLAMGLLSGQVGGYWVMVPIQTEIGKDLALVIQHENPVAAEEPNSRGWKEILFPIGSAQSYHAEVHLPDGVAFRKEYTQKALPAPPESIRVSKSQLTLYFSKAQISEYKSWPNVQRCLRLAEGGEKWPTRALAIGTVAMFMSGLVLRETIAARPAVGSAPVIVAAVSLAAAMALQREASETQRLLSGSLRVSLYLVIFAAAIGAGSLAINWPVDAAIQSLDWRTVAIAVAGVVVVSTAIGGALTYGLRTGLYLFFMPLVIAATLAATWPSGSLLHLLNWRFVAWGAVGLVTVAIAIAAKRKQGWFAAIYQAVVVAAIVTPFAVGWPQGALLHSIGWRAAAWAVGGLVAAVAATVTIATWLRHG